MTERKTGAAYNLFGFNGKEFDWEVKGWQNQLDYGARVYDPRIGKFLSTDPLEKDFPWYTPYQFAGNKPIWAEDLDGKEESVSTSKWYFNDKGALINTVTSDEYVQPEGTFRVGFKGQTTKEKIAEAFVKSNRLPTTGNFIFVEHQFNPGANYATYEYKDASGNPQIAHYDAKYINWMYEQLGLTQEKFEKGLKVAAAVLNLAGAGIIVKAELKGLTSDLKTNTNLSAAQNTAASQTLDKVALRKSYAEGVFKGAGKTGQDVDNLMATVDFNRTVKETVLKEGTLVYRYEKLNGKGGSEMHFFTNANGALKGARGVGFADESGYNLSIYEVTAPTKVMESTIRGTNTKQYFSTELQNNIRRKPTEE